MRLGGDRRPLLVLLPGPCARSRPGIIVSAALRNHPLAWRSPALLLVLVARARLSKAPAERERRGHVLQAQYSVPVRLQTHVTPARDSLDALPDRASVSGECAVGKVAKEGRDAQCEKPKHGPHRAHPSEHGQDCSRLRMDGPIVKEHSRRDVDWRSMIGAELLSKVALEWAESHMIVDVPVHHKLGREFSDASSAVVEEDGSRPLLLVQSCIVLHFDGPLLRACPRRRPVGHCWVCL
mmetsp:Transcript_42036/g.111444  ORF Transcript_42036/g.111444 Transcript_42036/m.111444 type:complete len:238 (-) Transcript_42036:2-715(-)